MTRKILQRYVFWELVGPTAMGLLVFTFILLATHLFRLTDLLLNRGVPFPLFGALVGTLLPPLLLLTTPMALLVGVLLGVGRLAADNEIVAMRTSGVHLLAIFTPVLIAATMLSSGLWYASGSTVPALVRTNRDLIDRIKFIVASSIQAGQVFEPETDHEVALYFRRRNEQTHRMEGIALKAVIKEQRKGQDARSRSKAQVFVTAREGHIESFPDEGYMDVILNDGTMLHLDDPTSITNYRHIVTPFGELRWQVRLTGGDVPQPGELPAKPQALTNDEIRELIGAGELDNDDEGALRGELHQRRSIPLACIAFALLGVPLAIRVRPTGKAVAFSIAFGLIFFYYVMLKWGVTLCQNGSAAGMFVIFLPNIAVGGLGIVLFYKALRQ